MHIERRHSWDVSPAEAIRLQVALAREIVDDQPIDLAAVRLVAGVDVSVKVTEAGSRSQAAVVVLTFPDLAVVETARADLPTSFPYIPGLLSFREGPVLEQAFARLEQTPDVFIFDGMGRIHPRRIGIASHMGLWLQKPTIGCGKTMFIGQYVEPPAERGAYVDLIDRGEVVGAILRTRANAKPVFISVGHKATLRSAVELVMRCTTRYRLPQPIREAHQAAGKF